tara:strand:+ start:211 stop:1251 length:1041 start_codon:yes stop_codon:yes gene_type:complete
MAGLIIIGSNPTANILRLACENIGLNKLAQIPTRYTPLVPATILPANISRVIVALKSEEQLRDLSIIPNRKMVRLGKSGYLISEIPLGKFYCDRYGANLINISEANLQLLLSDQTQSDQENVLEGYDVDQNVIALTDQAMREGKTKASFLTYYARQPLDKNSAHINTTWLGQKQIAFQFSTEETQHIVFLIPSDENIDPNQWHHSIRDAAGSALIQKPNAPKNPFDLDVSLLRSAVRLGSAWYQESWLFPETIHAGIEDAWVLSRMLENYEEETNEALSNYTKYRLPRMNRFTKFTDSESSKLLNTGGAQRFAQHLRLAFSTRFIPEIFISSQDWLHGYDCLRGFR